ncbi:MAG TPA: Na+/H+ antiporter subunit G [Longimicrobiales bacterium]
MMNELIVGFFLIAGAGFALIGSIGLARLPDFFSRLHGPTKSTTLGVGSMLIASAVHFSTGPGTSLHEVLVTVFLFLTAPVSAHLLCKAALHTGVDRGAAGDPGAAGDRDSSAD